MSHQSTGTDTSLPLPRSRSRSRLVSMVASKMLLLGPASTSPAALRGNCRNLMYRRARLGGASKVLSMAKEGSEGVSATIENVGIAGALISTPVIFWSLYTLKTTSYGLPPGPGGSIGALEGVSYLVVVGIVGWSLCTKSKTGSGLPPGPFGLFGAVEGLSYLSLLAILLVFTLQFFQQGSIPGPIPGGQCFR